MLRGQDKRLWLPSHRQRAATPTVGFPGAPGIASAMDGEIDWLRVAPPVTDYTVWFDSYDFRTIVGYGGSAVATEIWLGKKTGNVTYLAQATSGNRPSFYGTKLGQYYAVDFTGNAFMDGTDVVPARPMSMIAAYDCDSIASTNHFLFSATGGNNRIGVFFNAGDGSIEANWVGVSNLDSTLDTTTGPHVVGVAMSTTSTFWLYDGTTATVANSTSTTAGAFRLGQYAGGATNTFDGRIGEILLWDRELSSTELASMYRYLKAKWGTP